ncbi:MAG: hypothetical protein HC915_20870 [Anaerolineae bacterium]|nr:hypothetical protein [Anaerolineae bacterium]
MRRLWIAARLLFIFVGMALLLDQDHEDMRGVQARLLGATRHHSFNFVQWEVDALLSKARQEFWGYHAYIPEAERNALVLGYFDRKRQVFQLEEQIEAATGTNPAAVAALSQERDTLRAGLAEDQALVEHIIEGQVSAVLQEEGFAWLGQVLPPVTMRFLDIPDVLVVSPRHEIRQYTTLVLDPQDFASRVALEGQVAAALPEMAVWLTPVGGVGIYPSMVMETDRAVVAFEITAHEWVHHYLIFFPLGLEYLSRDETRIINETTASLVGDEIGNRVVDASIAPNWLLGGSICSLCQTTVNCWRQLAACRSRWIVRWGGGAPLH